MTTSDDDLLRLTKLTRGERAGLLGIVQCEDAAHQHTEVCRVACEVCTVLCPPDALYIGVCRACWNEHDQEMASGGAR